LVESGRITLEEAAVKIGPPTGKPSESVRGSGKKVYYQDRLIAKYPSTAFREPIRALPRNQSHAPEIKSYNWVYQASAQPIYEKPFV
jgi:hypothetical protein